VRQGLDHHLRARHLLRHVSLSSLTAARRNFGNKKGPVRDLFSRTGLFPRGPYPAWLMRPTTTRMFRTNVLRFEVGADDMPPFRPLSSASHRSAQKAAITRPI